MTKAEFDKIWIYRFHTPQAAGRWADHSLKSMMVILGDAVDEAEWWVVRMADAERLLHAGYEAAPRI